MTTERHLRVNAGRGGGGLGPQEGEEVAVLDWSRICPTSPNPHGVGELPHSLKAELHIDASGGRKNP